MGASVQDFLQSFDSLSESKKKELASEILRLSVKFDLPPLFDEELVANAEELFLELDRRESSG